MGTRKSAKHMAASAKRSSSGRTHSFVFQIGRDHKGRRTITTHLPRPKWLPHTPRIVRKTAHLLFRSRLRFAVLIIVVFLLAADIIPTLQPYFTAHTYALGSSSNLLPKANDQLADLIKYDAKNNVYNYNQNYTVQTDTKGLGGAKIVASAAGDPKKGVTVTDPSSNISINITPDFNVLPAKQQQNRILYPLGDGTGWVVYTLASDVIKEDILLNHANGDSMSLTYDLHLGNTLSARIVSGGNIGIYGNQMLSGQVSTGSAKDAQLLDKARKNAPKNQLLFVIPAPVVKESDRTKSVVNAHYELKGSKLTLIATGLKKANYPLDIDPSVYVNSIAQFELGNNESNINFDSTNDYIEKGFLSGALLDIGGWHTNAMPLQNPQGAGAQVLEPTWGAGVAAGDGFIYTVGGTNGSTVLSKTKWAAIDQSTSAVVTPLFDTPASTNSCYYSNSKANSSWCSDSSYNLPFALSNLSAVVYNGYLYAIGGTDGLGTNTGCTSGNKVCSNVYVAKLSANGEPISWSSTSSLIKGRMFAGAVAYNNKIYVVGGQTSSSLNGEATTEYASVKPDGTLSSWTASAGTSTGSLTTGLWGETLQQYNGYLYAVGGAQTTTAQTSVQYTKINSDGTLPAWNTTSTFTNARMAFGGQFATIYNGYMYITSGCTTLSTTACSSLTAITFNSTTQADFQYASINADGTLASWVQEIHATGSGDTPLESAASTAMTGYGLVSWAGTMYAVGGCTAVSTATNCSGTTQSQVKYGNINSGGYISQIFGSPASSFSPAGVTFIPNLPVTGTGANKLGGFGGGAVINNGYLYYIGGCATAACTTSAGAQNGNTAYVQLNSDGTTTSSWTVDSTNTISTAGTGAGVGLVGFGITVYDNVIYIVAGNNGTNDQNTIMYNPLNTNGSLSGAWQTSSFTFTTKMHYPFAFARADPTSSTTFNIYSIGGCIGTSLGCTSYVASASSVFKCTATIGGGVTACTVTGQLQLLGTGFSQLALFAGVVYGSYIYLVGGSNGTNSTSQYIQYAAIDSSGNIVKPPGTTGANWEFTATTIDTGTSAGGGTDTALSGASAARRRTYGYATNGYLYIFGGYSASVLNDIQYVKIDIDTGNIPTNFTVMTTTMSSRWDSRVVSANGYVYILGGCVTGAAPTCTTTPATTKVNEYVQVYNNYSASPLAYNTASNNVGTDYVGGASTVYNGYLYYAGGCTNIGCTAFTNTVRYAQISATGDLGTWNTTSAMGASRAFFGLAVANGYMYAIGGQNTTTGAVCTTEHALIGTGTVGAWVADTAIGSTSGTTTCTTGDERADAGFTSFNNYVYVVGGKNNAGTLQTTTYYALLGTGSIGNWATTTAFSTARTGAVAVAYGQTLYLIGGLDGSGKYLMDVQYVNLAANGSAGTWNYATSLPQPINRAAGFAANGYLYLFGGRSAATTCTTNTYTAPINGYAAGSTSRNGIGNWSQTVLGFADARYGQAATYYGGKTYLLGGGCSALVGTGTGTTANRAVYGTLQIQPQISSYSIAFDFGEDVAPSKDLINGVDNGVGAQWKLNYLSSTQAANCWGGASGVSTVSLSSPTTFPLLTDSCSNSSFDQYYFLFLTVDASQAFGFPEDYTRGPNIQNLTLQYISNPSKRLRNGKTYTNGIQQPLNTPF